VAVGIPVLTVICYEFEY